MDFRLLLPAVVVLNAAYSWASLAASPALEIVTVAPNTARSSGGHSALRLGDRAYQYQVNANSLLLLRRDSWHFFEHHFRQLDNRTLTLVRLDLADTDTQRITRHLDRLFAIQQKHIARWRALKVEQQWFEHLGNGNLVVSIPTLAYFNPSKKNIPDTLQLKSSVAAVLGKSFLNNELSALEGRLLAAAHITSHCPKNDIEAGVFPTASEIEAERRLEQLSLREALIILKQERGISSAQLVSPDDHPLSKNDRSQLQQLALSYQRSIPRLLLSSRPDRGEALLLACARYGAIQHSLRENQLFLLNVFPADERALTLIDAKTAKRHHQLLEDLSEQSQQLWTDLRTFQVTSSHTLSEYAYQKMEDNASRYVQARDALLRGQNLLTCGPALLLPLRKARITPLKTPPQPAENLTIIIQQSELSYNNYLADIRRIYAYTLLKHNCTTELLKAVQSTFTNQGETIRSLGAVIKADKGLTLIPSIFSQKVQKHWKTSGTRTLPSRRIEQSHSLISQNSKLWIKLRESNRLTSTVYPGSIHDDAFLFFSDGKKILRPLQGSANLLYGLSNTTLGIITAPTEGGRLRTKRGLRGMLYSLPEIIGISIRKGRYDILPKNEE